jgi:hypothetical protein
LTLLVVAVLLIVALLRVIRIAPENRTYIIGWDVDPPDQVATKSGEPTGFGMTQKQLLPESRTSIIKRMLACPLHAKI